MSLSALRSSSSAAALLNALDNEHHTQGTLPLCNEHLGRTLAMRMGPRAAGSRCSCWARCICICICIMLAMWLCEKWGGLVASFRSGGSTQWAWQCAGWLHPGHPSVCTHARTHAQAPHTHKTHTYAHTHA